MTFYDISHLRSGLAASSFAFLLCLALNLVFAPHGGTEGKKERTLYFALNFSWKEIKTIEFLLSADVQTCLSTLISFNLMQSLNL